MKKQQNRTIRQYYRRACVLTVFAAALLAVLRIVLTPLAFEQPAPYGIALGVSGILLVALLVLSALKYVPPITVVGRMAWVSAAGAAVAGAALTVFSLVTAYDWFVQGMAPYPNAGVFTNFDRLFLYLLIASGIVGGVCFLLVAVRWWRAQCTVRGYMQLLVLIPVLWTGIRLIRYIVSHVSSLGLFRNAYDLGTIVFEMLFFLMFARYLSRVGEKPSRFFFGVSLCTGLLCAISAITQVAFFLMQDQQAFDTCALVVAPDFGVALFAFSMAFAQSFGTECEEDPILEESAEQPEEEPNEDEDGEGAQYLLSDQWFAVYDPEEDEQNT